MRTEARPLGQTIRYAYDGNGNLTERIDPLNQRQVHTYDDANRRTRTEAFAAGAGTASRTVTFTFDPRGLLTGYDDGTTSATYVHDANGRKQSEIVDYGRFSLTQGYGYHPNGQKASWTAPDGTLIGFAYTGHGELREVTVPGQGAITMSDFRWTRPETVSYPGGAIRSERYDALQRTREITLRAGAETRMDWRYTYDSVGNISRIDTEHGRYAFGYDALDRLTEADYPNGPQNDQINGSFAPNTFPFADDGFSYDPVGNRLSSQSQPGPWAYNGNHELQQSPFGTTTFNLAGSTTEERTPTDQLIRRFTYDTEERPVEVSNAQGQRIARYYHDPFGRRLWKTLEPGAEGHSGGPAPETVYLAYNDEGYAAEFRLPGPPETAPTTGPASFTTIWVHEPDGLWSTGAIAMKTADGWRYPQHDHLATPRMVIDGQGAVTTTIRMNAFGETRHQGESIANRFPGQLYDAETGLHYNWFRSYEARAGRYTQADPIGIEGGINLALYANANALTHKDPTGKAPIVPAVLAMCMRYPALCRAVIICINNPFACSTKLCNQTCVGYQRICKAEFERKCTQPRDGCESSTFKCAYNGLCCAARIACNACSFAGLGHRDRQTGERTRRDQASEEDCRSATRCCEMATKKCARCPESFGG